MPKAKKPPTPKATLAATFGELASPKPIHPRQPDAKLLRICRELLVLGTADAVRRPKRNRRHGNSITRSRPLVTRVWFRG